MVFSSVVFLCVFLPAVLLIYSIINKSLRNSFLLLASLFFYAWGEPKYALILIGSILFNYALALVIHRFEDRRKPKLKRAALWIAILVDCGVLFVFKYLNFTLTNINKVLELFSATPESACLAVTNIALPIGISFFTFQEMSYVIDVYRGTEPVQKNPVDLGLYISFFPQLIAGPIVRYKTIAAQIANRKTTLESFTGGAERFIVGLAKKVLIANTVAVAADYAFQLAAAERISCGLAWFGAVSYALQIYFDFSGYSDMAIGLGRMFGFQIPENFNYPYAAKSVTDFWRRWHISLSMWFRDYVYIPLGGSRVKTGRMLFNLFVVWLLTGIWHGANWTFLAWGAYYYVLLSFEKLTHISNTIEKKGPAAAYRVVSLFFILFGWVLFRSDNIAIAGRYIKCMFMAYGSIANSPDTLYLLSAYTGVVIAAMLLSVPLLRKLGGWLAAKLGANASAAGRAVVLLALLMVSLATTVSSTYNPFIYFNF